MTAPEDEEVNVCSNGNVHDGEAHPCPFAEEIDDDDEDRCNCCESCVADCADAI